VANNNDIGNIKAESEYEIAQKITSTIQWGTGGGNNHMWHWHHHGNEHHKHLQ